MPKSTCPRRAAATCDCRFAKLAPRHHDVLVQVESNVAMALELLELATTWEELDYSGEEMIPPSDWIDFAAIHDWRDPALADRLFSVALDVINRSPQLALAARDRR